jgi:hypothetical protein
VLKEATLARPAPVAYQWHGKRGVHTWIETPAADVRTGIGWQPNDCRRRAVRVDTNGTTSSLWCDPTDSPLAEPSDLGRAAPVADQKN